MPQSPKFVFVFALLFATSGMAFPTPPPPPLDPDVVPIKMEKSDVADALDMLMWKFRVTTKKPNTKLTFQLSYLPLGTDYKLPSIPPFHCVQEATTEEIFIAVYPQSDGWHYFFRTQNSKRTYVQEDKLEGWGKSYGVEDGMPIPSRSKEGYMLFEFNRPPKQPGQLYDTIDVLMTAKLTDK